MTSQMEDSLEVAPLTRKDLKEELRSFAQGWLAEALRDALRKEGTLIAREVYEHISGEEDRDSWARGFAARTSQTPLFRKSLSDIKTTPPPAKPAAKRKTMALGSAPPGVFKSKRPSTNGGMLRPSSKYAEHHAAQKGANVKARKSDMPQRHDDDAAYVTLAPREVSRDRASWPQAQAQSPMQEAVSALVESSIFEQFSGLLVILNAVSLGYDTNHMATNPGAPPSKLTDFTEPFFCIIFLAEFLLRLFAFGRNLLIMDGWRWNLLDGVLVSTQCLEQVLLCVTSHRGHQETTHSLHSSSPNIGIFRVLRLLRIVRIARLLRAFHLFDDLRVIVSSIMSSITSLGWSIFLLLILIYAFSLIFLQSIVSVGKTKHHDQIHYWFSSLFRTFLTMFECVVGGVSWDEVVSPIVLDISPLLGVMFCVYIAACLFAMMNLLTGVFVDKAMMSVREDKDTVLATRIRDLFLSTSHVDEGNFLDEITWDDFQTKLDTPAMKDYFLQINVDISEAQLLFDLMDQDGSGSLNSEEIIRACLRLRGPARALELSMLMKDVYELSEQVRSTDTVMRNLLEAMEHLPVPMPVSMSNAPSVGRASVESSAAAFGVCASIQEEDVDRFA